MRLRWSAAAALTLAMLASGARAQVIIARQADKLRSVSITTPKGGLRVTGRPWGNTVLTAESGAALHLADPLLGRLHWRKEQTRRTISPWGHPSVFETARAVEIQDPSRPGSLIVLITIENTEAGIRKDVAVLVEPGESVAYVSSRVVALRDAQTIDDEASLWMAPAGEFDFIVDGHEIEAADKRREVIKRWAAALKRDGSAGFGVVALPGAAPKAGRGPASAGFRMDDKVKAGWFQLSKLPRGPMKAGETRLLRYALVWGDALKADRVADLARQAENGGLDAKPWPLPRPEPDAQDKPLD